MSIAFSYRSGSYFISWSYLSFFYSLIHNKDSAIESSSQKLKNVVILSSIITINNNFTVYYGDTVYEYNIFAYFMIHNSNFNRTGNVMSQDYIIE